MEWINLKLQKPKPYENVLLTDGSSIWVGYNLKDLHIFLANHPDYNREYCDSNFTSSTYITVCKPTHWMPLTLPPKDEYMKRMKDNHAH